MKYVRKLLIEYQQLLLSIAFSLVAVLGVAAPAYAAPTPGEKIQCSGGPQFGTTSVAGHNGQGENCLVTLYIDPLVNILGGLVGVFIVISIVIAGIQYSAAAGDAGKVAAAKGRIQKAVIALLAYAFLLAFVNYLLPGGTAGK
jgi:hypothetical protein